MIFISILIGLFALDLGIKGAIEAQEASLFPRKLKGWGGKITLHKNHNPGFSFGFLKEKPALVKLIPFMVTSAFAGIFMWLLPQKGQKSEKFALAVLLGGAMSNLYDRFIRHYVVDYFSIDVGKLKKVVFNLGDWFIFLGTGWMVLTEIGHSLYNQWNNITK